MEKKYVSFETAKLLKKAGHCEPCDKFYDNNGELFDVYPDMMPDGIMNSDDEDIFAAPTLIDAKEWLKNELGILVMTDYEYYGNLTSNETTQFAFGSMFYEMGELNENGNVKLHSNANLYDNEDEALADGIYMATNWYVKRNHKPGQQRNKVWKPTEKSLPYDIVKLLDEKGFPVKNAENWYCEYDSVQQCKDKISEHNYPMISPDVVKDWLYEEKCIFIEIHINNSEEKFSWVLYNTSGNMLPFNGFSSNTPEQALENAIRECLEKII